MNIFQEMKERVTARQVAERYRIIIPIQDCIVIRTHLWVCIDRGFSENNRNGMIIKNYIKMI